MTDQIFDGLDVAREIESTQAQRLGETVLLWEGDRLDGFAVCHSGAGTEAGVEACYVKFGVARPGPNAEGRFGRLLEACGTLARQRGLTRVDAGVNLARHPAYRLIARTGSGLRFWAWRCTAQTSRATAMLMPSSSTIGASRRQDPGGALARVLIP